MTTAITAERSEQIYFQRLLILIPIIYVLCYGYSMLCSGYIILFLICLRLGFVLLAFIFSSTDFTQFGLSSCLLQFVAFVGNLKWTRASLRNIIRGHMLTKTAIVHVYSYIVYFKIAGEYGLWDIQNTKKKMKSTENYENVGKTFLFIAHRKWRDCITWQTKMIHLYSIFPLFLYN